MHTKHKGLYRENLRDVAVLENVQSFFYSGELSLHFCMWNFSYTSRCILRLVCGKKITDKCMENSKQDWMLFSTAASLKFCL